LIDCRDSITERERGELLRSARKERIGAADNEPVCTNGA